MKGLYAIYNWCIQLILRLIYSVRNFVKAAILSLVVILVISLLLTEMEQALTMVVDLIESDGFALILSYFFIAALALSLSHYPVYTYYATNLNQSQQYIDWQEEKVFERGPLKWMRVYVYNFSGNGSYKIDFIVNFLRYGIGILVFGVWTNIIITSFEANLKFNDFPIAATRFISYACLIIPYLIYFRLKIKVYQKIGDLPRLFKKLSIAFFIVCLLSLLCLITVVWFETFSQAGLLLLLFLNVLMVCNYLLFRLLRAKMDLVKDSYKGIRYSLVRRFIKMLSFLQVSKNYLLFFTTIFFLAGGFILYTVVASLNGYQLINGIPILLANLYFYSFLITSIGKYFFVANRLTINKSIDGKFGKDMYQSIGFKLMISVLVFMVLAAGLGKLTEIRIHELDLVPQAEAPLEEAAFIQKIKEKDDQTLCFIASHGGGLKANIWTLKVLNELQARSRGQLLQQSVALSGASGGSLGLALYTEMYRQYGKDTVKIKEIIQNIAMENFTSIDLSMVLGPDTYKKLWPLNTLSSGKDRPYYAMLKYQNIIDQKRSKSLSKVPFRGQWNQIIEAHDYFPTLIMNTAATDGRRGIFWSLKTKRFNQIFPYAENLADIGHHQTISFYQAVSTTNRFPIFSPAAKIKGYGHYIDAGAIDNSGLLGCLDVLNYFDKRYDLFKGKRVAIIEIINSKSLYIRYLMATFLKEKGMLHFTLEENESSTIITDLKTGLNLDKIPGYLSGYLAEWEKEYPNNRKYYKIYMPHKVTVEEVENLLGGQFLGRTRKALTDFLSKRNQVIKDLTEDDPGFFKNYKYYEPTLSRHLSKSNIDYMSKILEHKTLVSAFEEVTGLLLEKH